MPELTTQWIGLGENPETLFNSQATVADNSVYALVAPVSPPPGLSAAEDANHKYEFAFWNVNGTLISNSTALIPVGTQPVTATAWYKFTSSIQGFSHACSVGWFSLEQDRVFTNEDSADWQSPISTVDGQPWNDEPVLSTDDKAHDIVLKTSIDNQWFHSVLVFSGNPVVNGMQMHVDQNAKNVSVLAFYEPFGQSQFQNLKQVLAKIRLPWKDLGQPARRDVVQLSKVIKLAQRPGPVPPVVLRELSTGIRRIKLANLDKRLKEIEETLFLLETAQLLTDRVTQSRGGK
jgi:hypothetical protein